MLVPNCYVTQKMCDKAVNTHPSTIKFVPEYYPTGQIYLCGIFLKHPHEIFPGYSEKIPYEIQENIPK